MPELQERVPPQDTAAETAVLGSMLIDRDAIALVGSVIQAADYYRQAHQDIHGAIMNLYGRNEPVDLITLTGELRQMDRLEAIGGAAYLTALTNAVPTSANAESYARLVRSAAMRRAYIAAGTKVVGLGYEGPDQPAELSEAVERVIYAVGNGRREGRLCYLDAIVNPVLDEIFSVKQTGIARGIPSGFPDLDGCIGGLYPSDLIIIAARPAMGKTSFAMNIVDHVSGAQGKTAVIFSMEMSREQLVTRMLSARSGINSDILRRGHTSSQQDKELMAASGQIYDLHIAIDDTSAQTIMGMRAACRRVQAEKGLDLVVVDFLQLVQGPRGTENRFQEVSQITRDLKQLAREFNVPVVVLSQLSRAVESREDKRPRLPDLRETGEIEQTADIILFIYREDYYGLLDDEGYVEDHRAQITVAKNRHGRTTQVYLYWDPEHTAFRNLDWRR